MSLLTVDVGGANETILRLVRAANVERRQIGKKRYAFAGNERSMIRAEKIVWSGVLLAVPASDAATIRALFALGAIVNCEGDVFNNGNVTIACMGEITDEMEVGGPYWEISLTLREVDGASSTVATVTAGPSVLVNWYDAQGPNFAALGLSGGDPVDTVWPDETANGYDAPPGNPSFPGVLASTALNGHPGVYLTALGNNQRGYGLPNSFAPTEGEAFIVMRAGDPNANFLLNGGGPFWNFGERTIGPYLPNAPGLTMRDNFGSDRAHSFTLTVDPTEPFLYHVRSKAGHFRAWVNGTLVYSSSVNPQYWGPFQNIGMWLAGGAFYQPATLWIGEAKFCTGFMDPSTAVAAEASLMAKWSIP